jgi:hypothetical protein
MQVSSVMPIKVAQKCVSFSTIDTEYIVVVNAYNEVLWMKNFLQKLDMKQNKYNLFCDSESVIHLDNNPKFPLSNQKH